ncbi:hypothetical protein Z957_05225 [Clostridium sp. K25]|uniref:hypothetical protein n=1 Tax=Clostridium sp. K25 TaxID=1443109 RepID=UPI0004D8FD10|nr:hypothetical protein [Clostridium sp. K25]KEI09305.1 hypothetical protein Z957_05225 [Clostridium sp. K25]
MNNTVIKSKFDLYDKVEFINNRLIRKGRIINSKRNFIGTKYLIRYEEKFIEKVMWVKEKNIIKVI